MRKFAETPADYGSTAKSRNPGSTPGRTPSMESPPLHRFLSSVGRVQHHLYTAVVGLTGVEDGAATKPPDLHINWTPADPVGSAREARRFLLEATLVFAAESISEYAMGVLRYRHQEPNGDRSDRIRSLGAVDPSYLGVAPLIVSHWRNRIVHPKSKARLTNGERDLLRSQEATIFSEFKHLDVDALLTHFDNNRPALKDVTVLMAMTIRFARLIDAKLAAPSSARDVKTWLVAEELLETVVRLEKESKNGGSPDPRARAKQYLITEAPTLADPYYEYGLSDP